MIDYLRCPCGQRLARERPDVAVYRCPAADEDTHWVPYLAAWICAAGWLKYRTAVRRALEQKRPLPDPNPEAVEEVRMRRAALRTEARE